MPQALSHSARRQQAVARTQHRARARKRSHDYTCNAPRMVRVADDVTLGDDVEPNAQDA
jgi:hypothetical protein